VATSLRAATIRDSHQAIIDVRPPIMEESWIVRLIDSLHRCGIDRKIEVAIPRGILYEGFAGPKFVEANPVWELRRVTGAPPEWTVGDLGFGTRPKRRTLRGRVPRHQVSAPSEDGVSGFASSWRMK
jgi:hypothetical protein